MNNIKIIDSPMGYGKTSYLIQMINESPKDDKFIYITPFLDEVNRITKECRSKHFLQPTNKNSEGTKLKSFKNLVGMNKNIVATHSLLSMADEDLMNLIKAFGYTLILDEVMDVVSEANVTKDDINTMLQDKLIKIEDEDNGKVVWTKEDYNGRFNDIKTMADNESLYYVNNCLMVWSLPTKIFSMFNEVYVSTYMFDCQMQRYYYDYFGFKYDYYHVLKEDNKYKIEPTINYDYDKEFKKKAKSLINIIENEKLNVLGNYTGFRGQNKTALSKTWYLTHEKDGYLLALKKNTYNFFNNYCKGSKSSDNMWTTFKEYQNRLKGNGYTKGWIPINSRATNNYRNKKNCAYLINRYINPFFKQFFSKKGIIVDEDEFALSELLQWVWRSQIRDEKSINLYIPSQRMRDLLKEFLSN